MLPGTNSLFLHWAVEQGGAGGSTVQPRNAIFISQDDDADADGDDEV
jgi:hypothetical protein